MRRITLLMLVLVQACILAGQNRVTFQLDLGPLVKEELFSTAEGYRVFVRGSFNQWQGRDYELKRKKGSYLYLGTFELDGAAGDTLSYKFVIEKGVDRFFWEDKPDPANADHGNRRLVLKESDQQLQPALFHKNEYFSYPIIFSREKLQADFKQFRSILENTHPALYDYMPKAVLDSLFDHNYGAIGGNMDFEDFLMLMTDVISQVGCGHSSLWIPGDYWSVAPDGLFPLKLVPSGDRYYVTGSFSKSSRVPLGSVIGSINGEPFEKIIAHLESRTSADGLNQAFRRAQVAQNFALKYAMAYGLPESFTVGFQAPGQFREEEAVLLPVSKKQLDRGREERKELSLKEIEAGKVALLTINSFAYYGEVAMFRSFVDSVFQVIDQKGIQRLIMDLRGNRGGDPFCSSYLWGYLQHEPAPYFEDHYGRYDTLANVIPQPDNPYRGKLYTLIDGLGFSTTGHFCGLLKYHKVGSFVGSETGATYTCTGNATYPALKETGIMVGTARVMRYTAAVKGMDPRRGILPDYPLEPTPKDLISNRDRVLEYALSLASED
jgi:hypothetical protein